MVLLAVGRKEKKTRKVGKFLKIREMRDVCLRVFIWLTVWRLKKGEEAFSFFLGSRELTRYKGCSSLFHFREERRVKSRFLVWFRLRFWKGGGVPCLGASSFSFGDAPFPFD